VLSDVDGRHYLTDCNSVVAIHFIYRSGNGGRANKFLGMSNLKLTGGIDGPVGFDS
jgi:hypothetical protein